MKHANLPRAADRSDWPLALKSIRLDPFTVGMLALPLMWTLLLVGSLWWSLDQLHVTVQDLALVAARASFQKDLLFRQWASNHGGVYVPVTDQTPPNPYLSNIPERDITTPSGRRLTLMNPAYMTRQLYELGQQTDQHSGHLTSLNPILPANAPDDWERQALEAFERGVSEVSAITDINGQPHLRLIRPLTVTESCLRCHAAQGYKVGDIRGGLSVAVPMGEYEVIVAPYTRNTVVIHGGLWLVGLGLLAAISWSIHRRRRERQQADAALRASESRFRSYFELPLAGRAITSPDKGWLEVNSTLCTMLGYSRDELAHMTWAQLTHPDDIAADQVQFDRVMAGEIDGYTLEKRFIRRDGQIVFAELAVQCLRRPDGAVDYFVALIQDITERKRIEAALRQSEARYRSLFDHSPLSMWEEDFSQVKLYLDRLRAAGVTDIRAYLNQHPEAVQKCVGLIRVLDVNQATLDLLGLTDKRAALTSLDVTLTPEALATLRDEISTLAEGATNYAGEEVYRIGSGQSRMASVYVSIAPDYADTWERVVVSIVDVTERQRLETALRELNAELEQRVADRTAELRAANWRLTELDRLKDEFLSRTSHELRTPLTSIKIYLELLESGRPDKRDHYLQTLKREADRLHVLIEDVLQFSQLNLGAETIAFDQIDVNNLIRGRLTTWQNLNVQHHVPLDLELAPDLPVIRTNGELVAQALTRLVANALSYTATGSVTVSTARRDDDARPWVTISVADTGPGIAPDDLPHIFERFYRGHAAADFKTPGTGVGLAIVRVIADRLGGRLTVETQVGVGSTFTLWLPAHLQTSQHLPSRAGMDGA
jgi:PAS domain S-box-containing protein